MNSQKTRKQLFLIDGIIFATCFHTFYFSFCKITTFLKNSQKGKLHTGSAFVTIKTTMSDKDDQELKNDQKRHKSTFQKLRVGEQVAKVIQIVPIPYLITLVHRFTFWGHHFCQPWISLKFSWLTLCRWEKLWEWCLSLLTSYGHAAGSKGWHGRYSTLIF